MICIKIVLGFDSLSYTHNKQLFVNTFQEKSIPNSIAISTFGSKSYTESPKGPRHVLNWRIPPQASLDKHIKSVHDKIKDKLCHLCDFVSSDAAGIKGHVKSVHERIRDKRCELCPFVATKMGNLLQHVRAVHEKIKDQGGNFAKFD
jgi:hypothetical protein